MWKVHVQYDHEKETDDYEESREWEVAVCKGTPPDSWGWDSADSKWIIYSSGVGGQEWCPKRFKFMKKQARHIADQLNKRRRTYAH